MFVVVADELGGEITAQYSYGPSNRASWSNPNMGGLNPMGHLVSLAGTGTATDVGDQNDWASLAGGEALPGVSSTQIDASDAAVMAAGQHVNAALGTIEKPGPIGYAPVTNPATAENVGNSNSGSMAVANAARAAEGRTGTQPLPPGARAPGHGQAAHIPINQEAVTRTYERRARTGRRIRRRIDD